jgi:hypothetical protein
VRNLVSQRARWQRVITETVWAYRRMMLNPRYKAVGLLGMPYYLLVEVLAPIFQTLAVVALPVMWWQTGFHLAPTLAFLAAVALANGVLTNLALLMQDQSARLYRMGSLVKLIALGPLDLFLYRPFLFWAQAKGLVDFLRGKKGWNKFERNRREQTAA